ncbi:uncharacterized protein LOC126795560 [Argentina anserina]|uniref:uncharacterized protein LOC126795560 n=1 Tax=Argentina anserina TaxID=57926 RepID=UPI002176744C|nr:uncharacterized protein LOC126795560 [Potentilla anserina]
MIDSLNWELSGIRSSSGPGGSHEMEKAILMKLEVAWKLEEAFWKQRSRINWLLEGDINTKFFHLSTIYRRSRNRVSNICLDNGNWINGDNQINEAFTQFYNQLYTTNGPRDWNESLSAVTGQISSEQNAGLQSPFTSEEVFLTVKQLGNLKVPGPDGFPGLVMKMVTSVSFSVVINGSQGSSFSPSRGLRQGDPLSPYLFLLIGEVLSRHISADEADEIEPYMPGFSHLMFADDTILFTKATTDDCRALKKILDTERVGQNLEGLRANVLSQAGREVLIKTKVHWKNWNTLCKNKLDGGMGFKNLQAYNKTLLGKQCWRLAQNPNALWCIILKARYFPPSSFLRAKKGSKPSWILNSLLVGRETIDKNAMWRVGNGKSIEASDIQAIKAMPIGGERDNDVFLWPKSKKGSFSEQKMMLDNSKASSSHSINTQEESVEHSLLLCPWTSNVYDHGDNFMMIYFHLLEIWNQRCIAVMRKVVPNPIATICNIKRNFTSWTKAHESREGHSSEIRLITDASKNWRPHSPLFLVKLNVDAAWKNGISNSGMEIIIRGQSGESIIGANLLSSHNSVVEAEAEAVVRGLQLAVHAKLSSIVVDGYCLEVWML